MPLVKDLQSEAYKLNYLFSHLPLILPFGPIIFLTYNPYP